MLAWHGSKTRAPPTQPSRRAADVTGHNYPDNLYADHEERKARRTTYQGPLGTHPPTDPVTKPAHYQRAGIETIDYIRATLGDGFEAYCIGNVLKYVSRYREKGGIEDLRKAQVYLGWAIQPEGLERRIQPTSCDPERVPKWDPRWALEQSRDGVMNDLRDYGSAFVRHEWKDGNLVVTHVPLKDVYVAQPPNCDGHPMQAEALRDHDERLAGGESHL